MKYLSIDIETSGRNPEKHQILEIAVIVEDTNNRLSFEDIPKFRAILEHLEIVGEPHAINMNSRIFRILETPDSREQYSDFHNIENLYSIILEPENLIESLRNWLIDIFGTHETNYVCAGKNFSNFDKLFIDKLKFEYDYITFYHRSLDPVNHFVDYVNDIVPPSLDECLKRADLVNNNPHNALYDAWAVIELLRTQY